MIVSPNRDRRAERRESTRAEILEAAWAVARANGLAGLSLRDVAASIGMRRPSLYWYFNSKNAIYDAMFAQGNRQLLARLAEQTWPSNPTPRGDRWLRLIDEMVGMYADHVLHKRTPRRRQSSP